METGGYEAQGNDENERVSGVLLSLYFTLHNINYSTFLYTFIVKGVRETSGLPGYPTDSGSGHYRAPLPDPSALQGPFILSVASFLL